jgi:hypothetical protein
MRIKELLESASAVLYHTTEGTKAIDILQSNNFILSSIEKDGTDPFYSPRNGWQYYLSTTRIAGDRFSRTLAETNEGYRNTVTFKLDGTWFNKKGYITTPVNWYAIFYGRDHDSRESEYEDRIWSKTGTIPNTPITECHVLLTDINFLSEVQKIDSLCKSKNIACYIYDDIEKWLLRRPKLSKSLKSLL